MDYLDKKIIVYLGRTPDFLNEVFLQDDGQGAYNKEWNAKIGGRVGSSHIKGLAADIHCNSSRDRALIVKSLLEVGITRIGIAKTFIHCDVDKQKDQDVIWLYN